MKLKFNFIFENLKNLQEIWINYASAMERKDREPLEEESFLNHTWNHSFVFQHGKTFIFGGENEGLFIPSHFSPASMRDGYRAIKALKEYDNILFAVTEDLAPMLRKAGFWILPLKMKAEFRGKMTTKMISISSLKCLPAVGKIIWKYFQTGQICNWIKRPDSEDLRFDYWDYNLESEIDCLIYKKNKSEIPKTESQINKKSKQDKKRDRRFKICLKKAYKKSCY